jgi:hypothetical protein
MVNYQAPKKLQNINIVGGRGFVKKILMFSKTKNYQENTQVQ